MFLSILYITAGLTKKKKKTPTDTNPSNTNSPIQTLQINPPSQITLNPPSQTYVATIGLFRDPVLSEERVELLIATRLHFLDLNLRLGVHGKGSNEGDMDAEARVLARAL